MNLGKTGCSKAEKHPVCRVFQWLCSSLYTSFVYSFSDWAPILFLPPELDPRTRTRCDRWAPRGQYLRSCSFAWPWGAVLPTFCTSYFILVLALLGTEETKLFLFCCICFFKDAFFLKAYIQFKEGADQNQRAPLCFWNSNGQFHKGTNFPLKSTVDYNGKS